MPIAPGTRLGPYEVLAPLGAGGMGEVWCAMDTRLGREVAVKVLPASVAHDVDALARFEREAKAVAALSHPSILSIFDVGSEGETRYAVMELLEGETLRARLREGRLPPRKAVEIAIQVAGGLAAAHEKGIVHRDLKPENLFVSADGRAKILDFGLARHEPVPSGMDTESPTVDRDTDPHAVLGTAGYMSPEQVRGVPADHRSDLFSFGCVLYEMLSGERAFRGASAVETMNAILKDEPLELSAGTARVPPALERIVRHCLEKSPAERFQSARDLAFDLASLSEASSPSATAHVAASRSRRVRRRVLLGAGAAVALALAFLSGRTTAPEGLSPGAVSFRRLTFRRGNLLKAHVAPDGRTVVYSAAWEGRPAELFTVRTDSLESRPLGIPNADILSVSSKGELAILLKKGSLHAAGGGGTLARLPLGAGAPREVAEGVWAASWSPDGTELAVLTRRAGGAKARLEYPIGKTLYETEGSLGALSVSPKGDLVAFREYGSHAGDVLAVVDRGGKVRRLSGPWGSMLGMAWRPDGRAIVFGAGSRTGDMAVREVSLAGRERVLYPPGQGLILKDLLPDGGMLVERFLERDGIAMLSPGDEREREVSWLDGSAFPILSADGSTLVFREVGEGGGPAGSVFLRTAGAESPIRLGDGWALSLSPDGKWVLSLVPGPTAELVLLPTGAGTERRIALPGLTVLGGAMLPDGRSLRVWASEPGKPAGAWDVPIEGGKPRFVDSERAPGGQTFLPDGRIARHLGGGKGVVVSTDGGQRTPLGGLEPGDVVVWGSGDERHIFVFRPRETPCRVFRIEIETGKRELWKELMPEDPTGVIQAAFSVAISRDGRSYAYSYRRAIASDLYVLEGVK